MFNANFNVDYTDKAGVVVATGYANLNSIIDVHLSIKDREAYNADKDLIDGQEAAFRKKVMQVAEIMNIAVPDNNTSN